MHKWIAGSTCAAAVMSLAVFLLGAGEELWKSFMPKYLEALGAGAAAIWLFGTARDFLDAIYQYPGGYVSDRIGTRRDEEHCRKGDKTTEEDSAMLSGPVRKEPA